MGLQVEGQAVLGKAPELRTVGDTKVCELRVGFPRHRRNDQEQKWEQTSIVWTKVEVWNNEGERVYNTFQNIGHGRVHVIGGVALPDEFQASDQTQVRTIKIRARTVVPALSSIESITLRPKADANNDAPASDDGADPAEEWAAEAGAPTG